MRIIPSKSIDKLCRELAMVTYSGNDPDYLLNTRITELTRAPFNNCDVGFSIVRLSVIKWILIICALKGLVLR